MAREPGSEIDAIRRSLAAVGVAVAVEWVDETPSTNTDLVERIRKSQPLPETTLRIAASQTAGRGRHGRRWHAAPGTALTFSLCRPLMAEPVGLSLAIGAALADALDPPSPGRPVRLGLKWPNDLWLLDEPGVPGQGGRKVGGILIESVSGPHRDRAIVIGVGLNVLPQAVADAASGFACLREIDAAATPLSLLVGLAPALVAALVRFDRHGWAAFAGRFAERDVLRGRVVRAGSDEGVVDGVAATGELLLRTAHGLVSVVSGEVRVQTIAEAPC